MARIIHGSQRGIEVTIVQFCNDWISVDGADKAIFSPKQLEYTDDEKARIEAARERDDVGMMFSVFQWDGNRLVKRRF